MTSSTTESTANVTTELVDENGNVVTPEVKAAYDNRRFADKSPAQIVNMLKATAARMTTAIDEFAAQMAEAYVLKVHENVKPKMSWAAFCQDVLGTWKPDSAMRRALVGQFRAAGLPTADIASAVKASVRTVKSDVKDAGLANPERVGGQENRTDANPGSGAQTRDPDAFGKELDKAFTQARKDKKLSNKRVSEIIASKLTDDEISAWLLARKDDSQHVANLLYATGHAAILSPEYLASRTPEVLSGVTIADHVIAQAEAGDNMRPVTDLGDAQAKRAADKAGQKPAKKTDAKVTRGAGV
jgi:hypothetical protein